MAAKTTDRATTKRAVKRSEPEAPTTEEIAKRAFELFLARGGQHGHHEDDWLRAERELRQQRTLR